MVAILNSCGEIPLESEVVIAVPSLHLLSTKAMIRGDIAIAAEVRSAISSPLIVHYPTPKHTPLHLASTTPDLHKFESDRLPLLSNENTGCCI